MSTLHVAAIAANAAQHGSHGDPPAFVLIAGGIYFGSIVLTWILRGVIRVVPAGRWRNRLHATQILLCCLSSFQMSEANRKFVHAQARNMYAVWRKKHVGRIIVCLRPDGSLHHVPIVRAWWDNCSIIGADEAGGWVNISELLQQGGPIQTSNGGCLFTPERWAAVEPELRAFQEEQRRQRAAQQSAALSKEIMDALAVLGLTPAATMDDVTNARNRLMQAHHPDHGGSTAAAQRINAAHEVLRWAVRQAA
jgi:hypothetical protein